MDWRMGLCIVLPVPVAALILIAARKAQTKAESRNYDAHRAAYDGVQEYLDTIQELRSAGLEQEYLDGVEKKLDYVVKCDGVPHCSCGGVIKPDVVLYEEGLDEEVLSGAVNAIRHADTLIIGGTSLVVYPAAGLIRYFRGDHLVVINMQPTGADAEADLCIAKPIGQVLSEDVTLDL